MSDETQTATIGHNNPPTLFTPEELAADLAAACLELIDPRSKELTDSFDRWKKATSLPVRDADDRPMHDPTTGELLQTIYIKDDDIAQRTIDLHRLLKALADVIEARRSEIKKPFLAASQQIDSFFNTTKAGPITAMMTALRQATNDYQIRKDAEERREAAARAKQAADEAAKLAELAAKTDSQEIGNRAMEFEAEASYQARQAAAPIVSKEATNIRGAAGGGASLAVSFDFEIVDAKKVKRGYCSPDPKLIRAAIRAATINGECKISIDGVRIIRSVGTRMR